MTGEKNNNLHRLHESTHAKVIADALRGTIEPTFLMNTHRSISFVGNNIQTMFATLLLKDLPLFALNTYSIVWSKIVRDYLR